MQDEIWKPVVGYEAGYEISNLGRIRALEKISAQGHWLRAKLLKPVFHKQGYLCVVLFGRTKKGMLIHRIVLEAFVGPAPAGMEGCHNNGIKTDNRLSNLRWDTQSANQADRIRHGTAFTRANHPLAKLRPWDVERAADMSRCGATHDAIAALFGVSRRAVGTAIAETRNG